MVNKLVVLLVLVVCANIGTAQEVWGDTTDKPTLVQFSGVIVSTDSLNPVSFANVFEKTTLRGTMADIYGYFSFVAKAGDTIVFSAVGYKRDMYVVPAEPDQVIYPIIQTLEPDTLELDPAYVYPWPTKEQFADAFVNLDLSDDDLQRAYHNLSPQAMMQLAENMSMDASQTYKWSMNQKSATLYYAGQAPPQNIFSPIAWAQFINAWKRGDFKQDEDDFDWRRDD